MRVGFVYLLSTPQTSSQDLDLFFKHLMFSVRKQQGTGKPGSLHRRAPRAPGAKARRWEGGDAGSCSQVHGLLLAGEQAVGGRWHRFDVDLGAGKAERRW